MQVTKAVGDELRSSILRLLAHDSFSVLELCKLFKMAQPALSHHLKLLSEAGLVAKRRESTNVFYHRVRAQDDPLLSSIFEAIDRRVISTGMQQRIEKIYSERAKRSEQFFATHAKALHTQNELICPSSVYAPSVIEATCSANGKRDNALEIGPGSGELMLELSEHFRQVVGIDSSEQMLAVTAATIADRKNIQLIKKDFFALPRIRKYDALIAAMVIHHLASPKRFFRQAANVMKPKGTLVIAELCAHTQDWVKDLCGDLWLGFETDSLNGWAKDAGFISTHQQYLAQRNGFRIQINNYILSS